ncbi:MAG TPA: hypothetical protein VKI18_04045 [Albitalea sp.]|nr:hypothetical protein [Albitalea sp.]
MHGSVIIIGGGFIAGAPPRDDSADEAPLDTINRMLFDELIWPVVAARVLERNVI